MKGAKGGVIRQEGRKKSNRDALQGVMRKRKRRKRKMKMKRTVVQNSLITQHLMIHFPTSWGVSQRANE